MHGHDVVRGAAGGAAADRTAGQFAAVDGELTGREPGDDRAAESDVRGRRRLPRCRGCSSASILTEAADRRAAVYSGGMSRRLDLAAGLIGGAPVVLLDEPAAGLDPRSRRSYGASSPSWRAMASPCCSPPEYLEEADRFAARIAVVDHGRIRAEGTESELKAMVGGSVLTLRLPDAARIGEAARRQPASRWARRPQVNAAERGDRDHRERSERVRPGHPSSWTRAHHRAHLGRLQQPSLGAASAWASRPPGRATH